MKQFLIFVIEQVRDFLRLFFLAKTFLAPVAADELASAGEGVDGQTAVVGTALQFAMEVEYSRVLILSMESMVVWVPSL